ncbi:MAG: tetratricopeptide repeat protein [bacterium]|nr:tetratricopeptide repeat protein [bacterium]
MQSSIFSDFSNYFFREEIKSNLLKFDWMAVRKIRTAGQVITVDVLKHLKDIFKDDQVLFIIISGQAGSGKTKLLYEFARDSKKNSCFFADWQNKTVVQEKLADEFKQVPTSAKAIVLDDADRDAKGAIQFCLQLASSGVKFILVTRFADDFARLLKEFQITRTVKFELLEMDDLKAMLEFNQNEWLTLDIKEKLARLAAGNPDVLCVAHEYIDNKLQQKNDLDVSSLLSDISDRQQLFDLIKNDLYSEYGDQTLELIARTTLFQGLDRSDPFCKHSFRSYIQLRSLNYFYVQKDKIFFKPAILGEYLTLQYCFSGGEIQNVVNRILDEATPEQLKKFLSSLIIMYKSQPMPALKDCAGLILAAAGHKSINDSDLARLLLDFHQGFGDAKPIIASIPEIVELEVRAPEPELINQLAIFFAESKLYRSAAKNWEHLLEVARQKNLDGWLTVSYNNLGLVYQSLGEMDNAIECYQLAHDRFEAAGETAGVIQSLLNLAQVHQNKGDWQRAVKALKKAVQECEQTGDSGAAARAHIKIAQTYRRQQENNDALEHYHAATALFKKTNDSKGLIQVYGNLGIIYKTRNELDSAEEYFNKALKIAQAMNDVKSMAYTYNNLALVYQQRNEYQQAIDNYQKAVDYFTETNDHKSLAMALSNIALIRQSNEEWDDALELYEKAMTEIDSIGDQAGAADTFHNLGLIYQKKGEWRQAAEWYQKAIRAYDKLDLGEIAEIYGNLAVVLLKQNLIDEAIQAFLKTNTIMEQKKDFDGTAKTSANLGLAYFVQGEFEKAIRLLNQALFYYLKQNARESIKEITQEFKTIQQKISPAEFNRIAEQTLNGLSQSGVTWGDTTVVSGDEVRHILAKIKQKKVRRENE